MTAEGYQTYNNNNVMIYIILVRFVIIIYDVHRIIIISKLILIEKNI